MKENSAKEILRSMIQQIMDSVPGQHAACKTVFSGQRQCCAYLLFKLEKCITGYPFWVCKRDKDKNDRLAKETQNKLNYCCG